MRFKPTIRNCRRSPKSVRARAAESGRCGRAVSLRRHSGDWLGWQTSCASACTCNVAYFNVNRHINPTNVCVAACRRLCAFWPQKRYSRRFTPWRSKKLLKPRPPGYSEAVTEFTLCGRTGIPNLPFKYYLDLIAGLKERFPQVASQSSDHG